MEKQRRNILLVEDEPAHVKAIISAFRSYGDTFRVTVATSLLEAHNTWNSPSRTDGIGLAITDGNGLELLPGDKDALRYPIIIMTSHGSEEIAVEVMKKGALDYAVKSESMFADMPRISERALREWHLIKERKKAEEKLQESERRFRELVENLNDVIFSIDLDGTISYVSPPVERVLGYYPAELVGRKFQSLIHPDDIAETVKSFHDVLDNSLQPSEFRIRSNSAEYRWVRSSSRPILKEGKPVGISGVAVDITDRKKAEEALLESEQRYRTLFERAGDGIIVVDAEGQNEGAIFAANSVAAKMHGYEMEEFLKLKMSELDVPDESQQMERIMERLRGCEVITLEHKHIRKDGSILQMELSTGLFEIKGKKYLLSINRDITERKEIEKRLIEAQKMEAVGTLAGGIAHDFNNLLQVISGHAELLELDLAQRGMTYSEMDAIRHASQRGADLIKQILTFSRKVESKLEIMNLNVDIRNVELLLYRTIRK